MARRSKKKKPRPASIFKSRSLNPYYGDLPTPLYNTWSTSGHIYTSPKYQDYLENIGGHYVEGRTAAATSAIGFAGVGLEEFWSTTRRKPKFNECVHLKEQLINIPYAIATCNLPEYPLEAWRRYSFTRYYRQHMAGVTLDSVKDLLIVPWNDPRLDAMKRRAYWSMQPRFESEISMLNFIYELKDFRNLAQSVLSIARGGLLQKLWHLRSKMTQFSKANTAMQQALKTASASSSIWAEIILQINFAIKPLISDIESIFKAARVVEEMVQDEFVRRGHEAQKSHYTETLDEKYTGTWGTNNNRMWFTGRRAKSTFTATLEYSYTVKLREGWELIRRVWGLDITAEVIWNGLPFSFLLDYFYQVGKAIRNMQLDPNVDTHIFQYCESLNSTLFYGKAINTADSLVMKFYAPTLNKGKDLRLGFTTICGAEATHYHRRIDVPINRGTALPRPKGPSKDQLWNIAALIRGIMG